MDKKSLSPEVLAAEFGAKGSVARPAVQAMYEVLCTERPAALEVWKATFGKVCGYDIEQPTKPLVRLAEHYRLSPKTLRPEALLFALHTYYAAVVQRLVGRFRQLRHIDLLNGDPLGWFAESRSETICKPTRHIEDVLTEYDADSLGPAAGESGDLLKRLYEGLFPRPLRHSLGEYYTPDWLAEHVLDQVGYTGDPGQRLLDPACGSGTFLLAAIRRIRAREANPQAANTVGYDLNPLAVLAARANYLIALRDLLPDGGNVEIPIRLCDSILDRPSSDAPFDYVVGNPPWIAWDNLPDAYRQATKPLWQQYGLFSLSGNEARHGGAKKDLAMLMLYVCADRYLKPGGRLGMVVTQTLFQTKGAGDGFRRFRLGTDGPSLRVLRVDDLVALKPFGDAANWTSTIVLEKGSSTRYPLPYVVWSEAPLSHRERPESSSFAPRKNATFAERKATILKRRCQAQPIHPAQPTSPWFVCPEEMTVHLERLVGPSAYSAHLGANTGGANGVYWLEVLDRTAEGVLVRNMADQGAGTAATVQQVIEPDLIYPLVRWGDVKAYGTRPSAWLLLAQDPQTRTGLDETALRREYPRTYAYLEQFRPLLLTRAAYRRYQGQGPFYSMYNVGRYTVAPIKVVWRRMDRQIRAAVLEPVDDPVLGRRAVVPQETCALVACDSADEAHYLCAVLNSALVNILVACHSVRGGKGFGTPGMLDYLKILRFCSSDSSHMELAACSRQAHSVVAEEGSPLIIQSRIDKLAEARTQNAEC